MPRTFHRHNKGLSLRAHLAPARVHPAIIAASIAVCGLTPQLAPASVRRHDVLDTSFTTLANQPEFAATGSILSTIPIGLYGGSGVLVGDRWVLTAGHMIRANFGTIYDPSTVAFNVGGTEFNNGANYAAGEWFAHPSFNDSLTVGFDLALLHLTAPVAGITPAQRYTGSSELSATQTSVGYGKFGDGTTGDTGGYGTKRAGTNTIDSLGGVSFPGAGFLAATRFLVADFDHPSDPSQSTFGSSTPLAMELLPAHGDSGGPVFINDGGVQKVAGIISVGGAADGNIDSDYGDLEAATRVSLLNAWIDDQISAKYWNNGAGGPFATGTNWDAEAGVAAAPGAGNIAVFNIAGTYAVNVASPISNKRIRVRNGNVTLNLGGNTYTLGSSTLETSLAVARAVVDTASLTISNGTMSAADVGIAERPGTTGRLTIASGATLTASGTIGIGGTPTTSGGSGTLQIDAGGALAVGNGVRVHGAGRLLNSGSISWTGGLISLTSGGSFNNQTGALFDSQANTTLSGTPALINAGTLRKSAGTGTTTISTPVTNTGTIHVQSGSMSLTGGGTSNGGTFLVTSATNRLNLAGAFSLSGNNSASGAGIVSLGSFVTNSGTLKIETGVLLIASGTLNNSGTVDLNHRMILDYTGGSPIANLRTQLANGFANGAWTGNGIKSSSAAAVASNPANTHKTGIGYGEASTLGLTMFAGQTVDATALLFRYALSGDANIDGTVNSVDFTMLATNFNQTGRVWTQGDFNYDGTTNGIDFNSIAMNFGSSLASEPALGVLIPEPACVALFGASLLTLRRRRHPA